MNSAKNSSKRPWKRGEKLLFLAPLLVLGFAAFAYLWRDAQPVEIATLGVPMDWKFSPDGQFIAVEHQIKTVNALSVYDAKTGALKVDLNVPTTTVPKGIADLMSFAWASDSKSLAAGYFDLQTGTRKYALGTYSSKGKRTPNYIPKLVVWDFPAGTMRGYWLAAKPSEFAETPRPQFIRGDTQVWSEALPPSLFDTKTGKRLRAYGAIDDTDKWQIDAISKQELAEMRSVIARNSVLNFNADVELETKYDSTIEVGQLESRQAKLRNSSTAQFWPMPEHLYANQVTLAHRTRQVALTDWSNRRINERGNRNLESSRLIVWDFAAAREVWRRNAKEITATAWSNNDRLISWVESNGANTKKLYIADARTGETLWQTDGKISRPVFSLDDSRIAYQDGAILKIVSLPLGLLETKP